MRALFSLFLLAPLASADVRVVSPQGPFTQIQAAVDAANDGDLVLVKPGSSYVGFHVQAKSLSIVGDAGLTGVTVLGTVIVSDLAAAQIVSLTGLFVHGGAVAGVNVHFGLYSSNNLGSVRCQGCTFWSDAPTAIPANGYDGVRIESSSDVSLTACNIRGSGSNAEPGIPFIYTVGGAGLDCSSSTLTLCDSTIYGGWGGFSFSFQSGDGGPGLGSTNSTIFSSNCTIDGGWGGDGWTTGPSPGQGGAGIFINPYWTSTVRVLDCALAGGPNGDYESTGQTAPAYVGVLVFVSGTARTLAVAQNPLRELNAVSLSFHGAPGEQVYLLVGLETAVQWDATRLANFLIAPPQYRMLFVGTTNATGDLGISLPFSDLGGTTQSRMYYLQPLFSGAGGAQQLGTPITLAVLDQAF